MILKYRRIRDLREDHDLLQKDVADKLNLSQRAYSHYESGDRTIPPQILSSIADIYQVSVDFILERTDNPKLNQ